MSGMYTSGLIGLTEENVGIDRRFYTNSTDTNPTRAVSYNNGRVDVYLNGVKLVGNHAGNSNHDYTMDNVTGTGTTITLVTGVALVASDVLELVGYVSNSSNTVQTFNFNVTTNTTAFTASHTASSLVNVYLNGVLLDSSDYTLNGTDTVTLGSNAVNGDVVAIQVIGALDYANFVPAGGGTFSGNVAVNGDLTVDTNKLKVDSSGGHIGIGTASPTTFGGFTTVHHKNASGDAINLTETDGGVISQEIVTDSSSGSVLIGARSDHPLRLTVNDSEKVRIDTSGNVGIGSTNPIDGILVVEKPSSNSDIAIKSGGSGTHSQLYHITASRRYNVGVHGTTSKYFIYDNNANSTRLEINTTGDVTVGQGNLVIGTNGKGISFENHSVSSATGASSTTSNNVLDDYEEGTWTPGITGATLFGTPSGAPSGTYTKVGNVVSVFATFINVEITGVSGYAYITGLPFNTTATSAGHTAHNNMSTVSQFLISGSGALATADNSLGTTNAWHAGSGKYLNFQATYRTS